MKVYLAKRDDGKVWFSSLEQGDAFTYEEGSEFLYIKTYCGGRYGSKWAWVSLGAGDTFSGNTNHRVLKVDAKVCLV